MPRCKNAAMRSQWVGWSQNRAYHRSQAVQWPFILYGDSLTEVWKGTQGCKPYSQRSGFDALRQLYLSPLSNADGMSWWVRRPAPVPCA